MGLIEPKAADPEVIARLGQLLQQSADDKLSTTCALGFSTTIFAWVAQRVRRVDDPVAEALKAKWEATDASDEPWTMPGPLGEMNVFDALVRLRRASAHADGSRTQPENDQKCLVGFVFDATHDPFVVLEQDLRRFGVLIAQEFSAHMRAAEQQE